LTKVIKHSSIRRDEKIARYASLPALVLILFLIAVPLALIFYSSFRNVSFSHIFGNDFVGFSNYAYIFKDRNFLNSIFVTLMFSFVTVSISYFLGLLSAVLLDGTFRFKKIVFVIVLLPWAMPLVPSAIVWKWMLNANYGVLNWMLTVVGLTDSMMNVFISKELAFIAISLVTIWKEFPIPLLMIYAAIQNIPQDQYESAKVEGVKKWQEILYITIPNVRSISYMVIMLQLLSSFRAVTAIFVMTGGGPLRSTETLALYTFIEAFEFYNFGEASAAGVLTLLIIFSVVYLINRITKEGGE
jgi:multiple sugar transport system permease protein